MNDRNIIEEDQLDPQPGISKGHFLSGVSPVKDLGFAGSRFSLSNSILSNTKFVNYSGPYYPNQVHKHKTLLCQSKY